ncbi:hypothetical protein MASR2M79_22410 [Aminivibrio sp.]
MRGCALMQNCCGALVIKHTNPCGMARGETPREAYERAFACDPLSAFGGVVGLSRPVDLETVLAIADRFTEVLLAPEYDEKALALLEEKKPSLRVLRWKGGRVYPMSYTGTWSGLLVQEDSLPPLPNLSSGEWIGTPREDLWEDILFAWKVAALSKSNAIAVVKDGAAVGIGRGFCSRLHAVDFRRPPGGESAGGRFSPPTPSFPSPTEFRPLPTRGLMPSSSPAVR